MTPIAAVLTYAILAAAGLVAFGWTIRQGEKEWNQRERVLPESPRTGEGPQPPAG